MTRRIYLVGEFPGYSDGAVFAELATALGGRLFAFPDTHICGEKDWSSWAGAWPRPRSLQLPFLSLARDALSAFELSACLPPDARLQLGVSPAIRRRWAGLDPAVWKDVDTAYNRQLAECLAAVCDETDPQRLSIRVTLPVPTLRELAEAVDVHEAFERAALALAALLEPVVPQVSVSVHLNCREGASYKMTGEDAVFMTRLANSLVKRLPGRISLVHIPAPLQHDNDAFFAALADLSNEPRLALGLVHLSDGLEGAKRRIAFAEPHCPDFLVSPRSGFATRSPSQIVQFLALLSAVADLPAGQSVRVSDLEVKR